MARTVALMALLLAALTLAAPVAAAECAFCLDSVALQTRDGKAWVEGQPITLVVHVASTAGEGAPATAEAVVMQTDGNRTKCLGVPLKLISADAAGATYAGLFFPFSAARFDGKLVVGGDVQDIAFDVKSLAAGAGPAGELPAAERLDTSATLPSPVTSEQLGATALGGLALLALGGVVLRGRRRPLRATSGA